MLFKRLSFYLAIIGIAATVFMVRKLQTKPPAPPPVAEPTRSPYEHFVAASGIIEARRENVSIATPRQGLVTAVYVAVGQTVSSNAPLLQLDDRTARARVETLKAQLAGIEAQRKVDEVAVADWADQYQLAQRLERDQVATEDATKRKGFMLEAAKAKLAKLDADLAILRAQIDEAKTEADILTVRAPRDGKILQVDIRAGEYANLTAAKPVMILGDVNTLQIRADVDEQDAPLVVAGQDGTAYLKGSTDKKMPLRFTRIEPFVVPKKSLTGDSGERVDTRVLQIIFEMDPPDFSIYVGQQVDVFIRRPGPAKGPATASNTASAR
jgi:multidrug efflux pump subunit AcrA (membrane-fusion protein)